MIDDADGLAASLPDFFALESAGWKGQDQSASFAPTVAEHGRQHGEGDQQHDHQAPCPSGREEGQQGQGRGRRVGLALALPLALVVGKSVQAPAAVEAPQVMEIDAAG